MKKTYRPGQGMELWRYGIISEFLHGDPGGKTMRERLEAASKRSWCHPDGRQMALSADTLRHWIYRYRKSGLGGLSDQTRSDCGSTEIPNVIQEKFAELRQYYPHHTTQRILRMLAEAGVWKGNECSRSAFYRFAREQGLGRRPATPSRTENACAFEYQAFGQLWTADFLHGPHVRQGRMRRKTYLFAIIDDASRYIVHARFYWSEGVESTLDGLAMAARRFGVPQKFYTDNGSAFRSEHLKLVAGRLSMHLPHTPPYRPQGRGKIERFFRTVRDQWLPTSDMVSIDALNEMLAKWLDCYHKSIHGAIKMSPLNKRLSIPKGVRPVPEVEDLEKKFRMHASRLVQRNGTISLNGKLYDVRGAIPGHRIDVAYLPWDLGTIWTGPEQSPTQEINLHRNAMLRTNQPIRERTVIQ